MKRVLLSAACISALLFIGGCSDSNKDNKQEAQKPSAVQQQTEAAKPAVTQPVTRAAHIKGSEVSLRKEPSISSQRLDFLNNNDKVIVLDEVGDSNRDDAILKEDLPVKSIDGRAETLTKGRAVSITSSDGEKATVTYQGADGQNATSIIPLSKLERISGKVWYNVKSAKGIGYVYGDYVVLEK